MAQNRFWHLAIPDSTARYAEWVNDEMDLEQVICPVNAGHRRGGKRLTDLSIALRGAGVEDFVWTWLRNCLIQDHVLDLFRRSGFTGFDVKPVKARFKRASEQQPPRLWELVTTGWAGMASAKSGIRLIEHCNACGLRRYSAWTDAKNLIDSAQWDGSDFFMVWPLSKYIFVTSRVADMIRDRGLSGIVLRPSTDLVFPPHVIPEIGGGRLSYWMPEEQARKLGGPLGID